MAVLRTEKPIQGAEEPEKLQETQCSVWLKYGVIITNLSVNM